MDFHMINGKLELCQIESIEKQDGTIVCFCKKHQTIVEKVFQDKSELNNLIKV